MKRFLAFFSLNILLVISAVSVSATPITGGPAGLLSPSNTVTFDELGNLQGQVITDQFLPYGVSFTNFGWDNATNGQAGSTGFSGGDLVNGISGYPSGTAIISFAQDVTAAAFATVGQYDTWNVSAWLDGGLVENFNLVLPLNPGAGYIGFSGIVFDSIQLSSRDGGITIDNLQFNTNPVPEPATMFLFGIGLLGLAGISRIKK